MENGPQFKVYKDGIYKSDRRYAHGVISTIAGIRDVLVFGNLYTDTFDSRNANVTIDELLIFEYSLIQDEVIMLYHSYQ